MSTDVVIEACNLGKAYRIWKDPSSRLKYPLLELLTSWLPRSLQPPSVRGDKASPYYRDFHALHDLSITVKRGEAVGIVGRNGSGKSTLLQMIAGTLTPSQGTVRREGRVAALLELGSGFNPDFTGRENVFLNGAVLGLSPEYIAQKFDSIAAFAEIGDFIEQPIRTYSSGMVMRLAFAVAAHVEPDVLIVDEALGVGDARFQLKCARTIDRFLERGGTLLFVSHDVSSVKRLCNHAILLEQGRLVYAGHPNDVTNLYSKLIAEGGSLAAIEPDIRLLQSRADLDHVPSPQVVVPPLAPLSAEQAKGGAVPASDAVLVRLTARIKELEMALQVRERSELADQLLAGERAKPGLSGQEFSYGGALGRILTIEVLDEQASPRTWFTSGEKATVRLLLESYESLPDPIFAMTIKNASGVEIYGTNTLFSRQPAAAMAQGEKRTVQFDFPVNLMPGSYFLSFGFTHYMGEELVVVHRRYDAVKLEVHGVDRTFGIANLNARISFGEAGKA